MSSNAWPTRILTRLQSGVNRDHGWGYRPERSSTAEPTALACMALASSSALDQTRQAGLRWLSAQQNADGSVPTVSTIESPAWTTSLAVLAWATSVNQSQSTYAEAITKAVQWLTMARGIPVSNDPEILGHDTQLIGWSWAERTHSWAEPTAYAILAMRAAGQHEHPRVREGVRLLLDRAIPGGGWNYGNTKVLGNTLRPFPATTGLVLCALAGETRDYRIEESLVYLRDALPGIRSPLSLGWGLMGLSAWRKRPVDAAQWLVECADRIHRRPTTTTEDAVLLLSAADLPVFLGAPHHVRG